MNFAFSANIFITNNLYSVTSAKAGAQLASSTAVESWIPAFAGMTGVGYVFSTSNISVSS